MDIKNIFGKVQAFGNSRADEDILDSALGNDDYEDSRKPKKFAKDIFGDDDDTPVGHFSSPSYNYSPTAALPDFTEDIEPLKGMDDMSFDSAPASNLYDINASKTRATSSSKFRLTFISLHDIYDAKNVANLMMEKNAIVVVNLSLLNEEQSKRAMDFLDGAKYVTKCVFARFTESICAFIPSDIELHGDFYNQVEL